MSDAPPFRFERTESSFLDKANNLRIRIYGWPEYNYSVAVEQIEGPMTDKWPLREKAYFEFIYWHWSEGERKLCAISSCSRNPAFDRDFPGRQDELFDAIFPLILPVDLFSFPELEEGVEAVEPVELRKHIRSHSRFYDSREPPGQARAVQGQPASPSAERDQERDPVTRFLYWLGRKLS